MWIASRILGHVATRVTGAFERGHECGSVCRVLYRVRSPQSEMQRPTDAPGSLSRAQIVHHPSMTRLVLAHWMA